MHWAGGARARKNEIAAKTSVRPSEGEDAVVSSIQNELKQSRVIPPEFHFPAFD